MPGRRESGDPSSATTTDCTEIVLEVLRYTFAQQGRSADWAKVESTYRANTKARGGGGGSGIDLQAALQSDWARRASTGRPTRRFACEDEHLSGVKASEAPYTNRIDKKGTCYKDFAKKGYPGVAIHHRVTDYAPRRAAPPPRTPPGWRS